MIETGVPTAITQQPPVFTTVCLGTTGSLSVGASGSNLTYRWRRNNIPLSDGPMPGGTILAGTASPTLTFSNASPDDAGSYSCLVQGACSPTSVASNPCETILGGRTFHVGAGQQFATIQNAINALNPCGTILVHPGTYNEHLSITTQRVRLESTDGPGVTIIDAGNPAGPLGSVISIEGAGENPASTVIKGFTLTGGSGRFLDAAPTESIGGGVNISLSGNETGSPLIENCIIQGNSSTLGGAGISADRTALRLRAVTIRDNHATGNSDFQFAALSVFAGSVDADRCVLSNNTFTNIGASSRLGGGAFIQECVRSCTFTNCLFTGNTADRGGAIYADTNEVNIINCTITGNSAGAGSGIYTSFTAPVNIRNSILWNNSGGPGTQIDSTGGTFAVTLSDIQPGSLGFSGGSNISADPRFIGSGNFRLAAGSPCIDAAGFGIINATGNLLDLDGNTRFVNDPSIPDTGSGGPNGTPPDMGAYERNPVPSDACPSAPALSAGSYPFSTLGATTDGPTEAGLCSGSGDDNVAADIWLRYIPACSGNATISLCGSSFDTKLAIYRGDACPTNPGAVAACNDDSCNLQSNIILPVLSGETLLIRIGGYLGATGTGTVTLSCASACSIDFNLDGDVNADDLGDFITCYFTVPPCDRAEFNGDGDLNADDLGDFITAYFQGC